MSRKKGTTSALSAYQKTASDKVPHVKYICIIGSVIVCLILAGIVCREFWRRLYTDNPHFIFTTLKFKPTNNFTTNDVVIKLSELGVEEHQITLPNLKLREIRQAFLTNPLIADIELRRRLPGTLDIVISEREPVASIMCASPMTIDRHGMILPPNIKGCPADMPRITGVANSGSLKIGQVIEDPMLKSALEFLRLARLREEQYLRCIKLIQIDNKNGTLCLYMEANGIFKSMAQVILPANDLKRSLDRLAAIVLDRSAKGQTLSSVDVTFEKNIPAKP